MTLLKNQGNGKRSDLAKTHDRNFFDIQHDMQQIFEHFWRSFGIATLADRSDLTPWPALDMSEDDQNLILRFDMPGLTVADIDVQISGHLLSVQGKREERIDKQAGGVRRFERRMGRFGRTITLPEYIDAEHLDAKYDSGVLTIVIPKLAGQKAKRLTIKSA